MVEVRKEEHHSNQTDLVEIIKDVYVWGSCSVLIVVASYMKISESERDKTFTRKKIFFEYENSKSESWANLVSRGGTIEMER